MNTKLTLTLEDEVIAKAKRYAQDRGESLSKLVESYFKLLTRNETKTFEETLHPDVRELYGCLNLPKGSDWKEELTDVLEEKYRVKSAR